MKYDGSAGVFLESTGHNLIRDKRNKGDGHRVAVKVFY